MAQAATKNTLKCVGFRKCIGCGQRKPKAEMVRFVIGPDDYVVPDLDEKLPGRGLWLSAEHEIFKIACSQNLFSKRAQRKIALTTDLAQRVEVLLVNKCIELLQLARRSGVLTVGFREVKQRLSKGARGLLVVAADGTPKSLCKITNMSRGSLIRSALTSNELGVVLGRERLVNVLVEEGGLSDRLARDLGRLSGLRKEPAVGVNVI